MVKLPKLRCLRCGNSWIPRVMHPSVCPKCMSAKWKTPRQANELGRTPKKRGNNASSI